ncbi:hypothetical protein, variant 2 [Microbotryum lychnidis-dioicae p1A1 Lamole]|uniref:Uncharacterized protein n=1 Tax=Microbotryum lychnidis-dioicae (strain p1A1 Lamole / MvSl-1064) TaxID=683840 RepID=U5HHM1_USTV1|nr:hypothetical protein, variant 1 [Microbotryum lychnidis-dioicae p1A1 Lamole]KDE02923.1 hypothetical protein, variant 2 [Microbotryum lychnidis-dioicae p1A1 Lamole]|eukprot:KDE02922.1 hypothetical protein, variant 1 [Microbotryum lychnidis-dioicae p1A1 Lamole]
MVGMWTPDYHTPKEFNLKDAFKLIQAKAQSNTTVWGRLGPAKQRDIVKYIRERTAFTRVTSGDWLWRNLLLMRWRMS